VVALEKELSVLRTFHKEHKRTINEQALKIQSIEKALAESENHLPPKQSAQVETRTVTDFAIARENSTLKTRNSTLATKLKE
jgi:hypothetical protein